MEKFIIILDAIAPYVPTAIVIAIGLLIVRNKDARIDALNERINVRDDRIKALESQSADVLADALNNRIKKLTDELARLREDDSTNSVQIAELEKERDRIAERLSGLFTLLKEYDLLCPDCGAPLSRRDHHWMTGHYDDREIDYSIEIAEYECGLLLVDGSEKHPCSRSS